MYKNYMTTILNMHIIIIIDYYCYYYYSLLRQKAAQLLQMQYNR